MQQILGLKISNFIESLEKNSIDFYASVKSLYLQNRLQKISNEEISNKSQDDRLGRNRQSKI